MKIRSSKQLKESIQNVDRVIENELLDTHVEIDPVLADAYQQNKEIELHVEKTLDELNKKAKEFVEKDPEANLPLENEYTKQLKLDESIEDFRLFEDGRQNRVAARDENDTDLYLDYDMLEFVYELLSAGSKGITNIAPKTPLVKRHADENDPNSPIIEKPMTKFSPNGSQIINKEYVYLLDLAPTQSKEIKINRSRIPKSIKEIIQEAAFKMEGPYEIQDTFDALCAKIASTVNKVGRDAVGYEFLNNLKTLGTPKISEAGNKVVVYSDDLDDFMQAAEGLSKYGITCETPVPKRNRTSHWDYSMIVNVPCYDDGEPMIFEDWLTENNFQLEDVMEPSVAKRFRKKFDKADKASREVTKKVIYDRYVKKAFNDATLDLEDVYAEMCNDMAAANIVCDKKLHDKFMKEFEDDFEDDE